MQNQIDIKKTTSVKCENTECGSQFFREDLMLRKASKFLTGEAKDKIIPIPVIRCTECGGINKEFKPQLLD